MNLKKNMITLLSAILLLLPFSTAFAQEPSPEPFFTPTEAKSETRDPLDAINEGNPDGEIGLAYIGYGTTIGYYKKCATDAFFYAALVNNAKESIDVTLPRRVKINNQYYYINSAEYRCAAIPPAEAAAHFADADKGEACALRNNKLVIPAQSAVSLRGTAINFSHDLTKGNQPASETEYLDLKFDIQIANTRKTALGSLSSTGSICDALNFLEVTPYNYVDGGYFIDPSMSRSCSMNYYFIVENTDAQYSTTVELPRTVELNGNRFDVGCKYLYPGCKVSGFRHYAWGILAENQKYTDPKYHFCDQDRAFGDNCYEYKSEWWLRIPPKTRIAVRGMVNNLCNDPSIYPLADSMLEIGLNISDAGSNKWWVDGVVTGKPSRVLNSKDFGTFDAYGLLQDRDIDEPIDRYLFEDSSLLETQSEIQTDGTVSSEVVPDKEP